VADPVGTVAFCGPGAGGPATSSAVLADIIAIARQAGSTWAGLGPATGPEAAGRPATTSAGSDVFAAPSGARYPIVR